MIEVELALQSFGAVKGLITGAFNAKLDQEVRAAQFEIQSKMLDLQGHLLNAIQERLSLVSELDEAKRKLRDLEEAKARLDGYELVQLDGEAYLYRAKDHKVDHYACPTCYDKGKVSVLQSRKIGSRQMFYECGTCKFSRAIGPDDPINYEAQGTYF